MSQVAGPSPAAEGPAARESGTQALDRALSVLLAFRSGGVERKVSDVSRELGLHKSTASRLFRALADTGFLQRNEETGAYRLGVTVFELGACFLEGLDMHALARPLLHQLAQDEGESVNLSIRDELDALSIYIERGTRNVQLVSRLGRRIPLWCSAAGKALLLDLDDEQIRAMFADTRFTPLTPNTITDLDTFAKRMHQVREQGGRSTTRRAKRACGSSPRRYATDSARSPPRSASPGRSSAWTRPASPNWPPPPYARRTSCRVSWVMAWVRSGATDRLRSVPARRPGAPARAAGPGR